MAIISEPEAVARFGERMSQFVSPLPKDGLSVVEAFIDFCRNVRIADAEDELNFEWGTARPFLLNAFTDLRENPCDYGDVEYQWIGLTRNIITVDGGDEDPCLCAFLYFGPARDADPSAHFIAVAEPDELDAALTEFMSTEYIGRLLATRPSRVVAFADYLG